MSLLHTGKTLPQGAARPGAERRGPRPSTTLPLPLPDVPGYPLRSHVPTCLRQRVCPCVTGELGPDPTCAFPGGSGGSYVPRFLTPVFSTLPTKHLNLVRKNK